MPNGRRKVPFSGKAKKLQLQNKKPTKPINNCDRGRVKPILLAGSSDSDDGKGLQEQAARLRPPTRGNASRYALQFKRETDAELMERRKEAWKAVIRLPESSLEVSTDDLFPDDLRFPVRPPWDFNMSKEYLDARENRYFTEYLKDIETRYKSALSYFEMNLETWRQLWRVIEMLDIALIIVDIRFCSLMFPPYLFEYLTTELGRNVIVVLNKVDLVPAALVVAWRHHLHQRFPGIRTITFTSLPSYNLRNATSRETGLNVTRCKGKMKMAAEGAQKLYTACKEIVGEEVDISSWNTKIIEEMNSEQMEDSAVEISETVKTPSPNYTKYRRFDGGVLTIGCIGQPNAGKSSLINALMGRKVVSVSKTPGHTKHFQTIYLTPEVRLCDCPGLVFPSLVPKELQALMGSYPIAQLRDPYSSVKYLAERIDLVTVLNLEHPEHEDEWSTRDICDGWAMKRGFHTARAARLDSYRAANHLLRMALEGKIRLAFTPPGFYAEKERWEAHPEVSSVKWVQGALNDTPQSPSSDSSEDEGAANNFETRRHLEDSNSPEGDEEDGGDTDDNFIPQNKFQALVALTD